MTDQAKVNTPHSTYADQQTKRDVYRAVLGGTDAIRKGGVKYLPKYPAESDASYKARLESATIDGLVRGGVDTLCGMVFDGEIDTEKVNSSIIPLLENVDNKGSSFNIFARDAFYESFDGFSFILVDMPTGKAADAEQEKQLGLRPYLNIYTAANVINWRYRINPISKKSELTLIVLKEAADEPDGDFGTKTVTRYRAFFWDGAKVTWQLWEEKDSTVVGPKEVVKIGDGVITAKLTGIPGAFVGSVTDDPKLLVEARNEVKAYQKESSLDAIEYLSVPQLLLKGRPSDQIGKAIPYGPETIIDVSADGDGKFIQIDSAGLEKLSATIKNIKNDIRQAVAYIASSATVQADDKTATQVVTEEKSKQARLIVWADELKDALELALMYMGQFLGLGDDAGSEIVLRTKWVIAAEQAAAMMNQPAAKGAVAGNDGK